jgi:hypothetical protein
MLSEKYLAFITLLYNSLQSVANQGLANNLFQHFTVIYLDVRSLIAGDLLVFLFHIVRIFKFQISFTQPLK